MLFYDMPSDRTAKQQPVRDQSTSDSGEQKPIALNQTYPASNCASFFMKTTRSI